MLFTTPNHLISPIFFCVMVVYVLYLTVLLFKSDIKLLGVRHEIAIDRLPSTHFLYRRNSTSPKYIVNETGLQDDITVVTAYFDIGSFRKGHQGTYNPQLYKQWMGSFLNLTNPVIAYMEAGYVGYFRQLRSHMPKHLTVVYTVNKEEMWAFSLKHRTAEVFHNQHVPASHPNNVIPAYSCAMHAKYELMLRSIQENPHKTKYFAWQDIGLFRDLVHTHHNRPIRIDPYRIELPHRFNHDKVAYTAVHKLNRDLSLRNIFEKDVVWLCGCFFIGHASKIAEWSLDYMRAVEWLLRVGLMSTDQQVIVAMHSKESEVQSIVQIQSYSSHGSEYNPWFYLGYLCRENGFYVLKKREMEKIQNQSQNRE